MTPKPDIAAQQHLRSVPAYWNALLEGRASYRDKISDEYRARGDSGGAFYHHQKAEELRKEATP